MRWGWGGYATWKRIQAHLTGATIPIRARKAPVVPLESPCPVVPLPVPVPLVDEL